MYATIDGRADRVGEGRIAEEGHLDAQAMLRRADHREPIGAQGLPRPVDEEVHRPGVVEARVARPARPQAADVRRAVQLDHIVEQIEVRVVANAHATEHQHALVDDEHLGVIEVIVHLQIDPGVRRQRRRQRVGLLPRDLEPMPIKAV